MRYSKKVPPIRPRRNPIAIEIANVGFSQKRTSGGGKARQLCAVLLGPTVTCMGVKLTISLAASSDLLCYLHNQCFESLSTGEAHDLR
jgi:hypothetical protein